MGKDEEINRILWKHDWEETPHYNGRGTTNDVYRNSGELRRVYNSGKKKSIGFYINNSNGMSMNISGLDPKKVVAIMEFLTENMMQD